MNESWHKLTAVVSSSQPSLQVKELYCCCATAKVWMPLEGLLSTRGQESRVALNIYFVLSNLLLQTTIMRWLHTGAC